MSLAENDCYRSAAERALGQVPWTRQLRGEDPVGDVDVYFVPGDNVVVCLEDDTHELPHMTSYAVTDASIQKLANTLFLQTDNEALAEQAFLGLAGGTARAPDRSAPRLKRHGRHDLVITVDCIESPDEPGSFLEAQLHCTAGGSGSISSTSSGGASTRAGASSGGGSIGRHQQAEVAMAHVMRVQRQLLLQAQEELRRLGSMDGIAALRLRSDDAGPVALLAPPVQCKARPRAGAGAGAGAASMSSRQGDNTLDPGYSASFAGFSQTQSQAQSQSQSPGRPSPGRPSPARPPPASLRPGATASLAFASQTGGEGSAGVPGGEALQGAPKPVPASQKGGGVTLGAGSKRAHALRIR